MLLWRYPHQTMCRLQIVWVRRAEFFVELDIYIHTNRGYSFKHGHLIFGYIACFIPSEAKILQFSKFTYCLCTQCNNFLFDAFLFLEEAQLFMHHNQGGKFQVNSCREAFLNAWRAVFREV